MKAQHSAPLWVAFQRIAPKKSHSSQNNPIRDDHPSPSQGSTVVGALDKNLGDPG